MLLKLNGLHTNSYILLIDVDTFPGINKNQYEVFKDYESIDIKSLLNTWMH